MKSFGSVRIKLEKRRRVFSFFTRQYLATIDGHTKRYAEKQTEG